MPSLEDIKKNFQTYAVVALCGVVSYLFLDNKSLNEKVENLHIKIEEEHKNDRAEILKALDRSTEAIINNSEIIESLQNKK